MLRPERDYPRPIGPRLSVEDLHAADILLSRGSGLISDLIVAADGASYSHSALWSGDNVIEAAVDGIVERPLYQPYGVYRHRSPLSADQSRAIVAYARCQVGLAYANPEFYLLGVLFALGVEIERPLLHAALHALGGERADKLVAVLEDLRPTREPMICSELVAVSYYKAASDRSLALRILRRSERPRAPIERDRHRDERAAPRRVAATGPDAGDELLEQLRQSCHRAVHRCPKLTPPLGSEEVRERKALLGTIALGAEGDTPLGVVTPGDLQFSPSLQYVGEIDEASPPVSARDGAMKQNPA